ncbi:MULTISPECIES: hypothetical protein [unclassified Paenibacillus]|uniref:hypothetical protein n=1 Tax=unclassified Paenibacillus TaxID=185978 RepID=UPI00278978AE|nr:MULTISPECIES: hypothetical protein [unclassified Paenibacillus]MDQ0897576.1 hypothetical protein [Paenibacillus sp. V4I7]MDQ0916417.1 hypothetical protein [Paenibacillus sp. V4I5]
MEIKGKVVKSLLMGFFAIIILTGCNSTKYGEFIGELKPQRSNYKLHLFYHNGDTPLNEMDEVQSFIHSNQVIQDNITEMEGHPYSEQLSKNLKKLDIGTYPMYVLMNKDGLVYKSPYLSEIKAFIKKELKMTGR